VSHEESPTVPRQRPSLPSAERFAVTVVEGPDQGRQWAVDASQPAPLLIGTGSGCEIRLSDRMVSRRHASVCVEETRLRLLDRGSTNGTFVDDMAVRDISISDSRVIQLGSTKLRIDRVGAVALQLTTASRFGRLVGASPRMRRLFPLCERLAQTEVPVVIEGETGVGKEQLAEAIHETGPRSEGPLVVFDCTAVAPTLIESELFGHEAGAFSGATHRHLGVFERAAGGTLLIDEIGDLPLEQQPKLLRAIERRSVRRVGGEVDIRVDVRLLAATRRDLDHEVYAGRFRDDLYHRIAVARVALPPLRERAGDVSRLARHFWVELGGDPARLPKEVLERWEDDPWPGNVRQLRNAVLRRLALGDLAELDAQPDAREHPGGRHRVGPGGDAVEAVLALELPLAEARQKIVDEFEQRYVERLLDEHDGNMARAAAAAGVARRHFRRIKAKTRHA